MSDPLTLTIPDLLETPVRDANKNLAGVHIVPSPEAPTTAARWWRIADFGVLGAWMAVVAFTLQYHEKWADEAQAWLIARDLNLKTIWFHELRYEGSPGLWHTILWVAQHLFHARYNALGYIGMAGAAAGVALLVFKAPFPRYIRWPLTFTYFMVYQYAVIARPYTLLPLLAFSAALLFKDLEHPERMTIVLVLLANLSLHGTILAGCLGLVYLMDAYRARGGLDARAWRKYWICIGVMAAVFLFVVIILKPTPDVGEFAKKDLLAKAPAAIRAMQPTKTAKLESVISGAFFDYWVPSALFVLFTAYWCFIRKRLLLFALPTGMLIALYVLVHGYAHHHGTVFLSSIIALWIAWPTRAETAAFDAVHRRAFFGITGILICLAVLNIWDAGVAMRNDYLYPYSGAEDAANYLRSVGADKEKIVGFLYGIVGVQPYFDHDLFTNIPTSYYHHGLPLLGFDLNVDEFRRMNPDYVITFTEQPEMMMQYDIPVLNAEGYRIVHFSDGYMIYKRGVYVRQCYFILRRVRP